MYLPPRRGIIISILGTIGAGKSWLLKRFGREYAKVKEPVEDNPFLDDFYKQKPGVVPTMEIWLHLKKQEALQLTSTNHKFIVTDWGISRAFATTLYKTGKMNEREYEAFCLADKLCNIIPDIIIFLCDVDFAWENMKKRGRECEKNVTKEYIERINLEYGTILAEYKAVFPMLQIYKYDNWGSIENKEERINTDILTPNLLPSINPSRTS